MKARAAPKPKFLVTVRNPMGRTRSWELKADDIEKAAAIACKRCTLQKAIPMRTSGAVGEPGWFYPHGPNPKWPFVGNPYYIAPVDPKAGS